jgi:hypothetical protein
VWRGPHPPEAAQVTGNGTIKGVFERCTDRARRVLTLAQEEARSLHHGFIGNIVSCVSRGTTLHMLKPDGAS